jgi:hypothetical protein
MHQQGSFMSTSSPTRLPDVFRLDDGRRVDQAGDWSARRREIGALIVDIEYGGMPPVPAAVVAEELHTHELERFGNACHSQYRLRAGGGVSFVLDLMIPNSKDGRGPRRPVILDGDNCWWPIADDIKQAVLERGYVLATFNRAEIAADTLAAGRTYGIYQAYPGGTYSTMSAWAWGYSRCIDFLVRQDFIDAERIVATGHSRGGKACLLAGALDERIALTAPNNSGCGGAGSYFHQGPRSETLADILRNFPYWFGPKLPSYLGRTAELPFDQHFLKAMVAPRALLTTEALDDYWANPSGTWLTHQAAREVFRLLGVEERLGICYRTGGHRHTLADWQALLEFADWHLRGRKPERSFLLSNPFPEMTHVPAPEGATMGKT